MFNGPGNLTSSPVALPFYSTLSCAWLEFCLGDVPNWVALQHLARHPLLSACSAVVLTLINTGDNVTTIDLTCIVVFCSSLKVRDRLFVVRVQPEHSCSGILRQLKEVIPSLKNQDQKKFCLHKPVLDIPASEVPAQLAQQHLGESLFIHDNVKSSFCPGPMMEIIVKLMSLFVSMTGNLVQFSI